MFCLFSQDIVERGGSEILKKMLVNNKHISITMDMLFGCLKQQQCLLQKLYYRARSINFHSGRGVKIYQSANLQCINSL